MKVSFTERLILKPFNMVFKNRMSFFLLCVAVSGRIFSRLSPNILYSSSSSSELRATQTSHLSNTFMMNEICLFLNNIQQAYRRKKKYCNTKPSTEEEVRLNGP